MFLKIIKAKKNSKRLLKICMDLIDQYEKSTNGFVPSCKSDLIHIIKERISASQDEIAGWQDYRIDYIKIAHTLLANGSFDLLASGKYHIYTGVLNSMGCASNLMTVYKESMEYALNHGFIDQDTKEEQYRYLLKCISEVG